MKLAIMQPYIFPYIGYFQLINTVDKFVVYDDVNFIKQGWINRNRILLNNKEYLFTVPIEKQSSFVNIANTRINTKLYDVWKAKFFKTLEQSYKKTPNYSTIMPLIEEVFSYKGSSISELAVASIVSVCDYLKIDTKIKNTSRDYHNDHLKAQERVLDICQKEEASIYINVSGGMDLYKHEDFTNQNLKLFFIKPRQVLYKQKKNEFIPGLSIIDVLMFNDPDTIHGFLNQYELI